MLYALQTSLVVAASVAVCLVHQQLQQPHSLVVDAFAQPVPHAPLRSGGFAEDSSGRSAGCLHSCVSGGRAIGGRPSRRRGARMMSMSSMAAPGAAAPSLSSGTMIDLSGDGGVTREVIQSGTGRQLTTGDIALLSYSAKVQDTGAEFAQADEYRCTLGDGTMISGWDIGLNGLRVGDRARFTCSSRYAYGDEGVTPVIPPGAQLEFEVSVLENEGNIMNPATFADSEPLTPRTPATIASEFAKRQDAAAKQADDAGGIEGFIAWVKTIYVFGLFEGQTGEEAPWYLKPIITFPLMFVVTYIAFGAVLYLNGISTSRTPAVKDDLDLVMNMIDAVGGLRA